MSYTAVMSYTGTRSFILALGLLTAASAAFGHHPPRFERCERFEFAGRLERIEWINPHVLLYIRSASGELHEVGWLNPHGLSRAGIERDTLRVGDHVTVEGGTRSDELAHKPILLSGIRRDGNGFEWSQPLQGC